MGGGGETDFPPSVGLPCSSLTVKQRKVIKSQQSEWDQQKQHVTVQFCAMQTTSSKCEEKSN